MANIKAYFQKLNTSVFPVKASEYIQSSILTDEDIDLLDENDEDFVEVQKLISESFPTALQVEPTKHSKQGLELRLKTVKKLYEKTKELKYKLRIKAIEKMLSQPEKYCSGGAMKMAKGGGVGDEIEIQSIGSDGTRGYKIYHKSSGALAKNKINGSYEFYDDEVEEINNKKNMESFYDGEYVFKVKNREKLGFDSFETGGNVGGNLEKELHKLQRDLNSSRLNSFRDGDTSEEEVARQRERAVKLARFNEVLQLLKEKESKNKMSTGGGVDDAPVDLFVRHGGWGLQRISESP